MSNVLVIRKAGQQQVGVQNALTGQGIQPQINLTGGGNIPISAYTTAYNPNLGYTGEKPSFSGEKPTGIAEGGDTNFYYGNQSYGQGNTGRQAANAQYNTEKDAHAAKPDYNLTTAGKVAGAATTALPAAWSMLNSLSDDSQGDIVSAAGSGALRAQATRATLGGSEKAAANFGNRFGGTPPASPTPTSPTPPTAPTGLEAAGLGDIDPRMLQQTRSNNQTPTSNQQSHIAKPTNNQVAVRGPNNMHERSKDIQNGPSMINGVDSKDAATTALENSDPNVSLGQDIMGRNKDALNVEEAKQRATGKDAKQAMLKSRRPWSYY